MSFLDLNQTPNNFSIPPTKITPRNTEEDGETTPAAEAPPQAVRKLASLPELTTPLRRASSAGPPSLQQSVRRTSGAGTRLGSAKRPIIVTPHGRAAQRQLDIRRAGLTPQRDRRKSGRAQQKETPRDDLRALSRILAPKTKPVIPEPQAEISHRELVREYDLDDDGIELQRPRLSLALEQDDDDDDDSLLLPPRSAGLEDENYTVQSVEFARRALSEQPPGRLSRGSFGSTRFSDAFDLHTTELGEDADASSYIGEKEALTVENLLSINGDSELPAENTETLRDIAFDRISVGGRESEVHATANIAGEDIDTFVFTVPPRSPNPVGEVSEEPEPEAEEIVDAPNLEVDESIGEDEKLEVDHMHASSSSPSAAAEDEAGMVDITMHEDEMETEQAARARPRKNIKISKHGIKYASLPTGVVRRLATTCARRAGNSKAKIDKETLAALMQATDWFFEQVADDLGAYANHAHRKTIDESDVVTLMGRQRQINATTTPFSLAQRYLPRELLQDLRMVPPTKSVRKRLQKVKEAVEEVVEE